MAKKVLFIVEGYNDEPDLIEKMYSACFLGKPDDYEFYVFDTNIHQLVPKLIDDGKVDDDLDLKLVLRSGETDPNKLDILSQKYSDIYMIFDFDPQQQDADLKNIEILLSYFTDSTEMGKLFINYPSCYVLNTSLFILIDYMPERFFQQIYRHKENYRI